MRPESMSTARHSGTAALAGNGVSAYRFGAALERADEAVQRAERHGAGWWQPETLRAKAEVLMAMQRDDAASELLERALAISREQGALSWTLRISRSIARCHVAGGRTDLAIGTLQAVLSEFTQGRDYEEPLGARQFIESPR